MAVIDFTCSSCGLSFSVPVLVSPVRCPCGVVTTTAEPADIQRAEYTTAQAISNSSQSIDNRHREHWASLHSHRFTTPALAREFYRQWQDTIPNIDCGCMAHWKELVRDFPPDFSSAEAFFTWGVEAHNKVNKRLKKTILTIEEAKALWQSSLPTQHS